MFCMLGTSHQFSRTCSPYLWEIIFGLAYTLHTDILGANSIGIKSILMTNYGLLRNQNIASCIKNTGIIPDYLIEGP